MIFSKQRDALLAAGLRIGQEGALGGGHGLVEVGLGAERNFIHRFFGRRIDDGGGLLDGGIDPGAVDVELHAVDHRKPLYLGAMEGERKRSAGILARKPGQLNPPYAGCRDAAGAGYKIRDATVARCCLIVVLPLREAQVGPSRASGMRDGVRVTVSRARALFDVEIRVAPPRDSLPVRATAAAPGDGIRRSHTAIFRCRTGAPTVRLSAASMMALASMP